MDALLQVQSDWTDKLNGESYFANIAIAMFRKKVVATEINARAPHLEGKNGKNGIGGLVNMPTILGIDPNLSTPQSIAVCTLDMIELPEMNFFTSIGVKISCEEAIRKARRVLQPLSLRGECFYHDEEARVIQPLPDIKEVYPGCVGYRLELKVRLNEPYSLKTAMPAASWVLGELQLQNNSGSAAIYITTDGSFPGPGNFGTKQDGTQGTAQMGASFPGIPSGTCVAYAAYAVGMDGSDVGVTIAP